PPHVHIAEGQLLAAAELDLSGPAADPAGHETGAAPGRLVIEEDSRAGVEAMALAVVDCDEVAVDLRHPIRAAGIEGRRLALRRFAGSTEHLRGGRLVEARLRADGPNGLEQSGDADRGVFGGRHRERPGL